MQQKIMHLLKIENQYKNIFTEVYFGYQNKFVQSEILTILDGFLSILRLTF